MMIKSFKLFKESVDVEPVYSKEQALELLDNFNDDLFEDLGMPLEDEGIEEGIELIYSYNRKLDESDQPVERLSNINWVIDHYKSDGKSLLKKSLDDWVEKSVRLEISTVTYLYSRLNYLDEVVEEVESSLKLYNVVNPRSKLLSAFMEILGILHKPATNLNEELVGDKRITDPEKYLSGMKKGMIDKLFFMNKIKPEVIVDFGCADGTMLKEVQKMDPNIQLIGYDLDPNMLKLAKNKLGDNVYLTTNWNDVVEHVSGMENVCLNLSSVIHEVYSYADHPNTIRKFWMEQVFIPQFKWVTIRDMMPELKAWNMHDSSHFAEVEKVRGKADPKQLESFESIWGTIDQDYRNFLHFLLKYTYTENWEREVRENYLPLSIQRFLTKIPSNWRTKFEDRFILPHTYNQVYKDFGVRLKHTTHVKFILESS